MRVAIIEDEPVNAQELATLINQYDDTIHIDAIIDSVSDSVKYLEEHQPDLLFLDIELADGSSFEIFNFVEVTSPIVFTTAYDQYSLQAFEQNSISYLLKPLTFDKIKRTFEKFTSIKRVFKDTVEKIQTEGANYKKNFLVKYGKRLIPIASQDIDYFYSKGNLCFLRTVQNREFISGKNLSQLEMILDPNQFFRISRQYIISRNIISHLEPYTKGQVKFHFKKDLAKPEIMSRDKTRQIKEWLTE